MGSDCLYQIITVMATATTSNNSILTNNEYSTLSNRSTAECCSELLPTRSEMVILIHKMVKWDDNQTELVTGKVSITYTVCSSKSEIV